MTIGIATTVSSSFISLLPAATVRLIKPTELTNRRRCLRGAAIHARNLHPYLRPLMPVYGNAASSRAVSARGKTTSGRKKLRAKCGYRRANPAKTDIPISDSSRVRDTRMTDNSTASHQLSPKFLDVTRTRARARLPEILAARR